MGGWLPEPALRYVADMLGMAYIRVYEIATFYTMFNLAPVGRYYVQVCGTTPCWLRGANEIKDTCRKVIGEPDHVTPDGLFSWTEVECLAACVNAPMAQINKDYYEDLTPESLESILADLKAGRPVTPGPQNGRQASAPLGGPITLDRCRALRQGGARRLTMRRRPASATEGDRSGKSRKPRPS